MTTLNVLHEIRRKRIMILDGAIGTMAQARGLGEADFRGARFSNHPCNLTGNNDLLNLTRPDFVASIYDAYLAAGADIIKTNTFSATSVAQADYQTNALSYEINLEGARIARACANAKSKQTP
jgi:5-methyltetrahydrofolate--homocysteine methyltransferase